MRPGAAHALVIGGTGMLRLACATLASRGAIVTVVARDRSRLDALEEEGAGRIAPLSCDYRDSQRLESAIAAAVRKRGRPDPTIAWIREDALEGLHAAVRALVATSGGERPSPSRLVHVLPSAARSPVVLGSLELPGSEFVVGQVHPWSRRPVA